MTEKKRIVVKYECLTCYAIFKANFEENKKEGICCPECGRKKLKVKTTKMISIVPDAYAEKMNNERLREIRENEKNGEEMVTHERDPFHVPEDKVEKVPNFECVNCLNQFQFDTKKADPSCPKCASVEVHVLRPTVRFIATPDPIILTKTERKRIKFIRSGYRNLIKFKTSAFSSVDIATRCGTPEKRLKLLRKQIEITVKEIEKLQDKKLMEYDKIISRQK